MKRLGFTALVTAMVMSLVPASGAVAAEGEVMMITGVVDGPLTGGVPKVVELLAVTDIADLSDFGVEAASNGALPTGAEFTFPAASVSAGEYIHIATETTGFEAYFGFEPDYTSQVASINGDDAILLYHQGEVVDTFGEPGVDGTGEPWEYTDGWAKRIADGPDGDTFVLGNWSFSGIDALDGTSTNDAADDPFPIVIPEPDPDPEPEVLEVFIHEVQGSGSASPLEDDRVIIEGVVVGDEETFERLAGFFVQEEDVDADDDPATSEGVFVFNHANDDVAVGDVVRVEGTVEERFDNTQLTDFVVIEHLTEEEIGEKDRTTTPAVVEFPLTAVSDLEAVEGMSVRFPQTLVVNEYFNYDRFGEVVVGLPMPGEDRHYTPTAVEEPGSAAMLDRLEWNTLSRITIDDAIDEQNPDEVIHPITRDEFVLDNRFRGGDQVSGLAGPVYFAFDLYRLLPTDFDEYERTERPGAPEPVGGTLRVAALNALNYFLTIDEGSDVCGADQSQECRGADTQEEFERQRAKLLEALIGLDADVVGLIEIENTPGVSPLADIVAGLNDALGPETYDYIDTGAIGSDAIKVGLIYRPAAVTFVGEAAVLDDPAFLDPAGSGEDRNRPAVAATFLEKGTGERFSVVVNHLKSKGSECGAGDDDPFAGNCNVTRTLAAAELGEWLESNPTNIKDDDWLIVGDLNSYDKEDPIDVLESEGYTDLLAEYQGELAYTYVFDGQFGYLDYGMSSDSLTSQVTGATAWHINSPEPDILDYDMTFKSDPQDALYEVNPYRSSDHDAVLVGLDLDQIPRD